MCRAMIVCELIEMCVVYASKIQLVSIALDFHVLLDKERTA
jgi:hypothetical protein